MGSDKKEKIVHQEAGPELPPPGDERREVLRERDDNLQEKAETLAAEGDVHSIDPKAMDVDRELAQQYDFEEGTMLIITNKQPGMAYNWANHGCQYGVDVTRKQAMGWKVVSGKDPECDHMRGADGTRRIGDLLLMRTSLERKALLDKWQEDKKNKKYGIGQEQTVDAEIAELARKHPGAFIIHQPQRTSRVGTAAEMLGPRAGSVSPDQKSTAARMLGDALREEIPGVPIPGRRS